MCEMQNNLSRVNMSREWVGYFLVVFSTYLGLSSGFQFCFWSVFSSKQQKRLNKDITSVITPQSDLCVCHRQTSKKHIFSFILYHIHSEIRAKKKNFFRIVQPASQHQRQMRSLVFFFKIRMKKGWSLLKQHHVVFVIYALCSAHFTWTDDICT